MQPCPACENSGKPGYYYATDEPQEGDGYRLCTVCKGAGQVEFFTPAEMERKERTRNGALRYWKTHPHGIRPATPAAELAILTDSSITPKEASWKLRRYGRHLQPQGVCQWRRRHHAEMH